MATKPALFAVMFPSVGSYLSCFAKKLFSKVSDQFRYKPRCTATEDGRGGGGGGVITACIWCRNVLLFFQFSCSLYSSIS